MQRRARLKAMFRHSSSEEVMSLWRSFYKQWHKAVIDMLTHWQVLHLTFCFSCLWLTMKYWMISGLLLDFSSTSVNTSNTSRSGQEKKLYTTHFDTEFKYDIAVKSVTLDCLPSRHLFQVHRHVRSTQWNRGRYADKGKGTSGQVVWYRAETII